MFQERLPTLSIRCFKSDKVRQTNFKEFLDDFVMKKTRTKPFQLLTVLCSALLDSMIVAFHFLIRISIMRAGKFKPAPSPRGTLVGSAPQIEI